MFNSKLKKTAISSYETSIANYNRIAENIQMVSSELMIER